MKKAFVTGANGFVGSFLLKHLVEQGMEVTAYILKGTDNGFLEKINPSLKNITIIEGNVLDWDSIKASLRDINYVFHLAGILQGYVQEDYDRVNVNGTKNILNACLQNNPNLEQVVLLSSSTAVGFGTDEDPLVETTFAKPHPRDYYGVSKYRMEQVASKYKEKLPLVIVRPCAVVGPGNKVILGNYKLAKYGFKLVFPGPRRPISIIDVEDLVSGIYLCAVTPAARDEIFHFSGENSASVEELAEILSYKVFNRKYGRLISIPVTYPIMKATTIIMETINKITKKPAPFINQAKILAAFAPGQVVCSDKAKEILGWEPKHSIASAVLHEGAWFVENGWV
ncbi:MAG: NAD-dependent epimerase/dehydratase family protein [Candidatus Heimdallarchaeota archaeon]